MQDLGAPWKERTGHEIKVICGANAVRREGELRPSRIIIIEIGLQR